MVDLPKILYVLRLQDECWYVGTTNDLAARVEAHRTGKDGAAWTRKHKVIEVAEAIPCTSPLMEDFKTKELMQRYGVLKVRGGSYCQIKLNPAQWETLTREFRMADGKCMACGESGHFLANCPLRVKKSKSKRKSSAVPKAKRTCSRCGRNNHNIRRCHAHTHFDGTPLTDRVVAIPEQEEESSSNEDD
jgi:hypothetical protein